MPVISYDCGPEKSSEESSESNDGSSSLSRLAIDTDNLILYVEFRNNKNPNKKIYRSTMTKTTMDDVIMTLENNYSKGQLIDGLKKAGLVYFEAIDTFPDVDIDHEKLIGDVLDDDDGDDDDDNDDNDGDDNDDENDDENDVDPDIDPDVDPEDFDPDAEKKLENKEYACSYCGLADTQSVVKSVDANNGEGRWFCNGRGHSSGSHIVQHLVRSKNKVVQLHKDSSMGDIVLECYNCGQKNVFLLGFIPAKSDTVVVLLCRDPCLTNGALKGMDWDLSTWKAIIDDKMFLPWLVKVPSERDQLRARRITAEQINKVEEMWRETPSATINDIDKPGADEDIQQVLEKYDDGYHYQNIMGPLVQMEAEHDRKMKENHRKEDISVRWDTSLSNKKIAILNFYIKDDSDMRLVIGDEILLKLDERITARYKRSPFNGVGHIMWINDGEVALEMTTHDVPTMITDGYTAEFVWKGISFDRMQFALKTFAIDNTSLSGYLYHRLLGHDVQPQTLKTMLPSRMSIDGLPELNQSQITALKNVLSSPLSLIQGPPGTGKTLVLSAIVANWLEMDPHAKILICAPSNTAADNIA
jgi:regulator of nonsense transcripts 1